MLTAFDKDLLNILQTQLPISKRPFADMAEALGCEEDVVIERLKYLKENGYVRRMGPFFDSSELGYEGVLVAVKVEPSKMQQVAEAINKYAGITHNYEREGVYNLWFTLLTPNRDAQAKVIDEISRIDGVEKLMSLKSKRKYKVNVKFNLK